MRFPRHLPSMQRKSCPIAWGQWILLSGQCFLFLTCLTGKCCFLGRFKLQKDCYQSCQSKRVLGIVEMTCGLVHAIYSLPEWQAVKLIFFAPCTYPMSRGLSIFLDSVEKEESKDPCSQGTKPKNSNQRPSRNKSSGVQVHCSRETIILHGRLPE